MSQSLKLRCSHAYQDDFSSYPLFAYRRYGAEYATSLAKKELNFSSFTSKSCRGFIWGDMYYGIAEPSTEEVQGMLRDVKPADSQVPVELAAG